MYYAAGRGEITLGIEVPKIRDTPLAREFMLPNELIEKTPEDGLSGKTGTDKDIQRGRNA